MQTAKEKMELLGRAPVAKALLTLGLPTMVGMLINALFNVVDAYFVGKLGTAQMGAISVSYPLGQIVVGLGLLFGNGAAAYLSRLLGKGDKETADKVTSTSIYSGLALAAIVIIICNLFLSTILKQMGAIESILPYALSYTRIFITFSLFNVFNVMMNNIVSSEGSPKIAMFALLTGALLNVGLDPLFIFVFQKGVQGAATATAISQMVSTAVYLLYILRKKSVFSFSIKKVTPKAEIMAEVLKIGIPTLVFQILSSMALSLINTKAKPYGASALAAMGTVAKLMSMGSLVVFGFLKGFQTIAGFSYGAKKYDRLSEAIKTAIVWSTAFCAVFGISVCIFSKSIIKQFTHDDLELIKIGAKALKINGLSFICFGFYTVYSFLFLVMGKAKEGFFLGACRQGICFLPAIIVLPQLFGLTGVLWSQSVADVLSAIITLGMALSLKRKLDVEKNQVSLNLAAVQSAS